MKITVRDVAFIVMMGLFLIMFIPFLWYSSFEYNQKLNITIGIAGVSIALILIYYFVLRKLKVNGFKVAAGFFLSMVILLIILSVWMYFDFLNAFGQVNTYFLIGETTVGAIPCLLAGSLILLYNHYKSRHKILMKIEKIVWAIIIIIISLFISGAIFSFFILYLPFGPSGNTSQNQIQTNWAAQITIVIFGEQYSIPADIGVTNQTTSKIFTTSTDGIIYKTETENVTLKDFFDEWGQNFNSTCILDYCNNAVNSMRMYVNNKENMDYENYIIQNGDVIIIDYR